MDFTAHRESLLAWYVELGRDPAWKEHAWRRAKELARDCPELYADFPLRLKAALKPPEQETPNAVPTH